MKYKLKSLILANRKSKLIFYYSSSKNKNKTKSKINSQTLDTCRICDNDSEFSFTKIINKFRNNNAKNPKIESNYDNQHHIQIFIKKLQNLNDYLDISDNSVILPCYCTNPVHKLCIIKYVIFTQNTNCKHCQFNYIFKGIDEEGNLDFCEKIIKVSKLSSFCLKFIFLFILIALIIIFSIYAYSLIQSTTYFWTTYIVYIFLIFCCILIIIRIFQQIKKINKMKSVKVLDVADIGSINSSENIQLSNSVEILYNFISLNFGIDYEDINYFKLLRRYNGDHKSLDQILSQHIIQEYKDDETSGFESQRSEMSGTENNFESSRRSEHTFKSSNSSLHNLLNTKEKSNENIISLKKKNSKDNINNHNHNHNKNKEKDSIIDIKKELKGIQEVRETESDNNLRDKLMTLNNNKSNKSDNNVVSFGSSVMENNSTNVSSKISGKVTNSTTSSNYKNKSEKSKSNMNISPPIRQLRLSDNNSKNTAPFTLELKKQKTKDEISKPKRPSQIDLIALKYNKGVDAIEEDHKEKLDSSHGFSVNNSSKMGTDKSLITPINISPVKSDFFRKCSNIDDQIKHSFRNSTSEIIHVVFEEEGLGDRVDKADSINKPNNKQNKEINLHAFNSDNIIGITSSEVVLTRIKNSFKKLRTEVLMGRRPRSADYSRPRLKKVSNNGKKDLFSQIKENKFYKEDKEDDFIENFDKGKSKSERDRLMKLTIHNSDLKYNSFLDDTPKSIKGQGIDINDQEKEFTIKDQIKFLLKENKDDIIEDNIPSNSSMDISSTEVINQK